MRIKKISDTFSDYRVELSFGQLVAIRDALEQSHADPMSDEMYQEINYYLSQVPGPGEDETEKKQSTEGLPTEDGAPNDTEMEANKLVPPPDEGEADLPSEGGEGRGIDAFFPNGRPGEEEAGLEAGGMGEVPPHGAGRRATDRMTPDEMSEIERRVPRPPAE